MVKRTTTQAQAGNIISGWFCDTANNKYEILLDAAEKHSGNKSALIRSIEGKAN